MEHARPPGASHEQWRAKAGRIAERIRQLGVERVLYGSDGTSSLLEPRSAVAAFRELPLSNEELRTIAARVAPYMRSGTMHAPRRMPDGKEWTTENLNVDTDGSYCYEDAELNCRGYGRLYTWDSAQRVCQSLGEAWRLPTTEEWRQLAKHLGGLREESDDSGKAAYTALLTGGSSGFKAVLGGGRASDDEQYARLEAHGFYWTASESGATSAWFYNFGRGALSLNRHRNGNKEMALSVRCVRE